MVCTPTLRPRCLTAAARSLDRGLWKSPKRWGGRTTVLAKANATRNAARSVASVRSPERSLRPKGNARSHRSRPRRPRRRCPFQRRHRPHELARRHRRRCGDAHRRRFSIESVQTRTKSADPPAQTPPRAASAATLPAANCRHARKIPPRLASNPVRIPIAARPQSGAVPRRRPTRRPTRRWNPR